MGVSAPDASCGPPAVPAQSPQSVPTGAAPTGPGRSCRPLRPQAPAAPRRGAYARVQPITIVAIDIKPGGSQNRINPNSRGTVPVAILSSPTFDAPTEVDPGSLTFGRTGEEPSLAECDAHPRDVNGDGLPDLTCHFHTLTAAFQPGDTHGVLKGKIVLGRPFTGRDSVTTARQK